MNSDLAAWIGVAVAALGGILGLMRWISGQLQETAKEAERALIETRSELTEADDRLADVISGVRTDFVDADERRDRAQNDYRHQHAQQVQIAIGELRRDFTAALNRLEDKIMHDLRTMQREHS